MNMSSWRAVGSDHRTRGAKGLEGPGAPPSRAGSRAGYWTQEYKIYLILSI